MNNELIQPKSFLDNLLYVDSFYEENKTLTMLLEENFDVLEKQVSQHKCVKNISKKKKEELQIEESFYVNLAKILKNSKEFYGKDINPSTLASIMSRIREKKGLSKFKKNSEKSNQYLQAVVSTPVAVTQQQPAKNERPQIQTEELSSVVVEESHLVSQVGDLSSGQVSQAQKMTLKEVYEKAINTDLGFKLEDSDDCKINIKDLLLEWIHPSVNYKKGRSINKVGDSLDKYREINEWEYKILKLILDYPIDDEGKKILIIGDHGLGKEKFQNTLINFYGLSFTPKERDDINDLIDRFTMVMKRTNKNFFNDIKELKYPNKQ